MRDRWERMRFSYAPVHDSGSSTKHKDHRREHKYASPRSGTCARCLYPLRPRECSSVGRYTDGCRIEHECPGSDVGKTRPISGAKEVEAVNVWLFVRYILSGGELARILYWAVHKCRMAPQKISRWRHPEKSTSKLHATFFYHACSFQRPDRRSIGSIVTRFKMFELPRSLRA